MDNPQTAPETGWLIETTAYGDDIHYWNGHMFDDDDWTKDSIEAVRFARKEDAQKIIDYIGWDNGVFAIEHGWG